MTNDVTGASERNDGRGAVGSPVERPVRPLMAGTKDEGLGRAVFHAVRYSGRYNIAACGGAACGSLVALSDAPEALRCRAPGCRAAFKRGA